MEKLLEVRNLTKKYYVGKMENKVVDNVSIDVDKGEFVVIMGASGSGKTSLMHLIAGIDDFDEGSIKYMPASGVTTKPPVDDTVDFGRMNGKAKAVFRQRNIGIVFQQQCLIPDLTVYENIMLPLMLKRRPLMLKRRPAGNGKQGKDIILRLCGQFGLTGHIRKYPSQLSGGQQQRAAILRSVVNEPPLLLCDEPTGSLNSAQTKRVMDLLSELNQKGQTIILVTHDTKVAVRGKRIVYIEDGHAGGELTFTKAEGAGQERVDKKEQELMDFLKERGW
ncbi:ABC transporter ATP-binding protein [Lachnospiraceae bacterium 62-26]